MKREKENFCYVHDEVFVVIVALDSDLVCRVSGDDDNNASIFHFLI